MTPAQQRKAERDWIINRTFFAIMGDFRRVDALDAYHQKRAPKARKKGKK